jgi:aryl carrier-like protein
VAALSSVSAIQVVWKACADISGGDAAAAPEPDTSLFDMGLDSLGLAELVIQLEEVYGEGCLTVDDILAAPTLREVASLLPSRPPTPPNEGGNNQDNSRLAASFVSDLSDRKGVRNSGGAALWRVRNSGNVPWPPGTQITIGGDEAGGLPACNLHVPSSRAAAVLPGEEVDVDVADLHEVAPTVTVKSGPLLKAAAPPSTAVRVPPKPPPPTKAAPHRAATPLGSWANTPPPAANAYSSTPKWTKDARFTPAAAATPVVGTPVADGPLDASVSAAVIERLAKMEAESRDLRELVLTLATSPGGLDFGT